MLRILRLKVQLGLLKLNTTLKQHTSSNQTYDPRQLQTDLANASVTLVQNNHHVLPIHLQAGQHIHILTPWGEQGAAIAEEIKILQAQGKLPGELTVSYDNLSSEFVRPNFSGLQLASQLRLAWDQCCMQPVLQPNESLH